jgi:hypothetical protein
LKKLNTAATFLLILLVTGCSGNNVRTENIERSLNNGVTANQNGMVNNNTTSVRDNPGIVKSKAQTPSDQQLHPPTTLTFFENVGIFNVPGDVVNKSPIAFLAPQTVKLTGNFTSVGDKPWVVGIQTWLGEKWVAPTESPLYDAEKPVNFNVLLTENFNALYDKPSKASATKGGLSPQIVQAVSTWGAYYKINTWLGQKWITIVPEGKRSARPVGVEPKKLEIKGVTPFYPLDVDLIQKQVMGSLAPQVVTTYKEVNGYYLIQTWLGFAWIRP